MGLYDEVSKDVAEAFDSDLADAVVEFTYRETLDGDLDTTTGIYAKTYDDAISRGVVLSLSSENIKQFGSDATSFKLLVLSVELSKDPKTDDIVIIARKESIIYGIDTDPLKATYSLICKE